MWYDEVATPGFAFLCPFAAHEDSRVSITKIYEDIYQAGRFQELWYYWDGKPLLMGYPDNLPEEIRDFFTFRPGQPDYRRGPTRPDHWGWLEVTPQQGYGPIDGGRFEQMTVGVAQNATHQLAPAAMNDPNGAYGRGYTRAAGFDHDQRAIAAGLNFQEQWEHALQADPNLIFVTGWNEWIAGRYANWQGTANAFPDQFNDEYSRDIEPMKDGFRDNFYYQLVANIRRYKGVPKPVPPSPPQTIDLNHGFEAWRQVQPDYHHHRGSTMHRHHRGYGSLVYQNHSGRNDIVLAKVARDRSHVYFYVKTDADLTPHTDPDWMTLLINTDRRQETGWEGFDWVVRCGSAEPGKGSLEALEPDGASRLVGDIIVVYRDCELMLAVPRRHLQMAHSSHLDFEFKWTDNLGVGDLMDVYLHGESAPGGRFNFHFQEL